MAKRKKKKQKLRQSRTSFNWGIIGGAIVAVLLVLIGGYFAFFAGNSAPAAQRVEVAQQLQVAEDTAGVVSAEAPSPSPSLPVAPQIGALAPDFTLVDTSGEQVSLADYRGKPVVVSFFHTW